MNARRRGLLLKALVWGIGLFPLARVAWWTREGLYGLGANPIERVLHHSGWWALTLLLLTLAITPLRRITGRNELIKLRRPMGLFAFFWATLHLGIYVGLDQLFAWEFILEDVLERPFITVGFAAWLILLPLAATSTRGWIRRLGPRWGLLHRSVYLAMLLGIIHYFWRVRADTREPLIFAALFIAVMVLRIRWTERPRGRGRGPRAPGTTSVAREAHRDAITGIMSTASVPRKAANAAVACAATRRISVFVIVISSIPDLSHVRQGVVSVSLLGHRTGRRPPGFQACAVLDSGGRPSVAPGAGNGHRGCDPALKPSGAGCRREEERFPQPRIGPWRN